jgi:hypothetical protein
MDDTAFHEEQMAAFRRFADKLADHVSAPGNAPLAPLAEQIGEVAGDDARIMDEGPALIARMLTTAPQLAEVFPRDLLWYLGGDCLHFMPDHEIEGFARLDEQRRDALVRGEAFSWRDARAALLRLQ